MTDPPFIPTDLSPTSSLGRVVAQPRWGRFALAHCCRRSGIGIIRHGKPIGVRAAEPTQPATPVLRGDNS